MLAQPSVPFGRQGGEVLPGGAVVELATGRELLVLAVLLASLMTVMWVLARTRRFPR